MEYKTPSLSEVKEYFKDAKKIQSIMGTKFENDGNFRGSKYAMDGDTSIYAKNGKYEVWNQHKGYAKILSYKEPKEKTYKITREQILELHKNSSCNSKYDIEQLFPEVLENKLTVGKWYWRYNKKELAVWNDGKITYGFRYDGLYLDRFSFTDTESVTEATEQEVTEALTKEAGKKGLKEGAYVMHNDKVHMITLGTCCGNKSGYFFDSFGRLLANVSIHYNVPVFDNGKWAEIIPTLTIKEAEAKLKEIGVNAKIV